MFNPMRYNPYFADSMYPSTYNYGTYGAGAYGAGAYGAGAYPYGAAAYPYAYPMDPVMDSYGAGYDPYDMDVGSVYSGLGGYDYASGYPARHSMYNNYGTYAYPYGYGAAAAYPRRGLFRSRSVGALRRRPFMY